MNKSACPMAIQCVPGLELCPTCASVASKVGALIAQPSSDELWEALRTLGAVLGEHGIETVRRAEAVGARVEVVTVFRGGPVVEMVIRLGGPQPTELERIMAESEEPRDGEWS